MHLGALRVVHILKKDSVIAPSFRPLAGHALILESCQRWLWIELASESVGVSHEFADVFCGSDAYGFLLAVATGLESEVVGETDIFGQLKDAWTRSRDSLTPELRKELSGWMQRIFEDTKEIRSRYLQNLGGSSYGSLLRKLMKDRGSLAVGPSLLVGAGQLAKSVAPYLLEHELWICNRTGDRAAELAFALVEQNPSARVRVIAPEDELVAIGQAAQVIFCVPEDPERDSARLRALSGNRASVFHLGLRVLGGEWAQHPEIASLEELFRIERAQSDVRFLRIDKARAACREKAILRALGGGSASIAHGWEDLAAFVS